jgi:hypothetical protein
MVKRMTFAGAGRAGRPRRQGSVAAAQAVARLPRDSFRPHPGAARVGRRSEVLRTLPRRLDQGRRAAVGRRIMAGGIITLGEMRATGMVMLEVACRRCGRCGRLRIERLIAEHGRDGYLRGPSAVNIVRPMSGKAGWRGSSTEVIIDAAYRRPNILRASGRHCEPAPAYARSSLEYGALRSAGIYRAGW